MFTRVVHRGGDFELRLGLRVPTRRPTHLEGGERSKWNFFLNVQRRQITTRLFASKRPGSKSFYRVKS
jgi:hypothetical protein